VAGTSLLVGGKPKVHGAVGPGGEVVSSPARLIFPENSLTASAVMVRRDVLLEVGGFNPGLRYLEDLDAWLRVLERGTGLLLGEVTCLYTLHGSQMSSDRGGMVAAGQGILDKYAGKPWLTARLRESAAVVDVWDDLQACRARRDWTGAAGKAGWLFSRPTRAKDLVRLLAFRWRARRFARQQEQRSP
jgi:hypothetical protein